MEKSIGIPTSAEEFITYLKKEKEDSISLRNEINEHIGEVKIAELRNKRNFLQNIVIASVTLLGFVSVFSLINPNGVINKAYFATGIGFHLFLICFVFVFLRESIDKDIEGLVESQDRYISVLEGKISVVEKHLINTIQKTDIFSENFLKAYLDEIRNLPNLQKVVQDNNNLTKDRENRMSGNTELEFNGEIIIFCFVFGTVMIFLSVLQIVLPLKYFLLMLLIIFYITFTDSLGEKLKPFFRVITFITRKDLLGKK